MTTDSFPTNPATQSTGSPLATALKKVLNQPQFLAAVIVLFVAALSLNAATQFLRLHFKKEPVPLARPLDQIPPTVGPWVKVSQDEALNPEVLDVLGTRQYIFRDYADSRLVPPEVLAKFNDLSTIERARLAAKIQHENPPAIVRVAVTYYTGMVDTVAHIPDRCYIADGFEPDTKETPRWTARDKNNQPINLTVSAIHFEDQTPERGAVTHNVAYFFHCNGEYEHDAITGVRMKLQNLFERDAYYAKVELMTRMQDRTKSDAVLQDFLGYFLPETEKCLPDWQELRKQREAVAKK